MRIRRNHHKTRKMSTSKRARDAVEAGSNKVQARGSNPDQFSFLEQHIDDVIVETSKTDGGHYYNAVYTKESVGRQKSMRVKFWGVHVTTSWAAKLTGKGNLGEKHHETEDKACYTLSCGFYREPPYWAEMIESYNKITKQKEIRPRIPKYDKATFFENQRRLIVTLRKLDERLWKLFWDIDTFDSSGKINAKIQKKTDIANEILKKEYRKAVKAGSDAELITLRNDQKADVDAVLNRTTGAMEEAMKEAFTAYYNNLEEKYKHLLPWPKNMDEQMDNPKYTKGIKNKKTNIVEDREVGLTITFSCDVYKRKAGATAHNYTKELEEAMLQRRHPDCAKYDAVLEVEERDTSPGAKEGDKKKVKYPYLYNQLWIKVGGNYETLKYSPDQPTSPILPNSVVIPEIQIKIMDSPLAVGASLKNLEVIYRAVQGERTLVDTKPEDFDGFVGEDVDMDEGDQSNNAPPPNSTNPPGGNNSNTDGGSNAPPSDGHSTGYPTSPPRDSNLQ